MASQAEDLAKFEYTVGMLPASTVVHDDIRKELIKAGELFLVEIGSGRVLMTSREAVQRVLRSRAQVVTE